MSYYPGTKLSCKDGEEEAVVLTDGIVMITLLDGAKWRERMKLVDWLILADGKEVVRYLPVIPMTTEVPAPSTDLPTVAPTPDAPNSASDDDTQNDTTPVIIDLQDYPYSTIVNRTKFKWVLDKENYCVAVQTPKGILQVKSVTNCPCRDISCGESYAKIFFNTFKDWVITLPNAGAGGKFILTAP